MIFSFPAWNDKSHEINFFCSLVVHPQPTKLDVEKCVRAQIWNSWDLIFIDGILIDHKPKMKSTWEGT